MNNLCMLWSLLEDMYINIGYRNGLPPETAAAVLQNVCTKVGEEGEKMCYKVFAADLHIAFTINTLTDNPQVHPEHLCHHSMQRVISARAGRVHHRCALTPFVWAVRYIYYYATSCTIILQVCEHFNVSAKGHARKHTVGRGCQPGLIPNKLHCSSFEGCFSSSLLT